MKMSDFYDLSIAVSYVFDLEGGKQYSTRSLFNPYVTWLNKFGFTVLKDITPEDEYDCYSGTYKTIKNDYSDLLINIVFVSNNVTGELEKVKKQLSDEEFNLLKFVLLKTVIQRYYKSELVSISSNNPVSNSCDSINKILARLNCTLDTYNKLCSYFKHVIIM